MRSPGSLGVSNENHRDFKLQMRLHGVLVGHRLTVEAPERAPLSHGVNQALRSADAFSQADRDLLTDLGFPLEALRCASQTHYPATVHPSHFDAGRIGDLK
jgi:hypothetical protein